MIDVVRGWLLCVTAAALIAALADSLMPKGPVRQVGRLACGVMLLWAVLSPVMKLNIPDAGAALRQYRGQIEAQQQLLEQQKGSMMKTLIERESAAYIVDKAAELGLVCTAQVTCAAGEGGAWLPWSVRISGELSPDGQERLGDLIRSELDVPPERQTYTGGERP